MKRHLKKLLRSPINRRIIASCGRLASLALVLSLFAVYSQIGDTNAYFSDKSSISSNAFSAGYWASPTVNAWLDSDEEDFVSDELEHIRWKADSSDPDATDSMDIKLEYHCDDDPWILIADHEENDSAFLWTMPSTLGTNCRVRVTAIDSHNLTGSAETDEFEISSPIVLNEFMPKPASGLNEWIEIYNRGDESVDIGQWYITDNQGPNNHKREINNGHTNTGNTIVSGHAYLVVEYAGGGFYFNDDGDDVRLYNTDRVLVDSHAYSADDVTIGDTIARFPSGTGDWIDPVPTPGEINTNDNSQEGFKKYYEDACFEKEKPVCDEEFMKKFGILPEEDSNKNDSADKNTPNSAPEPGTLPEPTPPYAEENPPVEEPSAPNGDTDIPIETELTPTADITPDSTPESAADASEPTDNPAPDGSAIDAANIEADKETEVSQSEEPAEEELEDVPETPTTQINSAADEVQ